MKKTTLSISILLVIFSFIFTGCGTPAATQAPTDTASANPIQESTPTEAPAPVDTAEQAPRAEVPIPCTIAFDSDRDGNLEIYRMAPDGSEQTNLSNDPADDFNPSWSPDGSQIAFVSNRDNGDGGGQFIYVMNADGSDVRQLTSDDMCDYPDWSNDGSRITYTSNDDIYVINADGSGQSRNLTNSPEKDTQPVWSPDDNKLGWMSGDGGNWNIFTMDGNGSSIQQVTFDGKVEYMQWTVNGQIFTNWDNQKYGCFNCVMDADGSNITDAGGKGELQRHLPFWTLEGERVECVQAALEGDNEEIYLVGEIFPDMFNNLTNNPAQDRNPDWPAKCGPASEAAINDVEQPKDPGQIVIGYAGDNPEQWQRKKNFQKACDELNILCVYGEIPELIEQNVSAIVQNSNNVVVPGLHQDILNARDKNIPVFLLDAESITHGAYSITINQQQRAKTSLAWMFEKIGGEGQIAYFDLDPFNRHTDTINEMLSKYPGINVVDYRDGKSSREDIQPQSVDFVAAYPDLKAIWTSFNMTQIIIGLQEETELPVDQWPVLVCDATMDGLDWWAKIQQTDADFDCMAVVNPPGIAYDAVYTAYYLVTGAQIDESVLSGQYGQSLYVDTPVITSDNFQEWFDKTLSENVEIVDVLMTPDEIREKWFID